MQEYHVYLILAFVFVGLSFIVPQMMNLRIKILNFLTFKRLANWHERNFHVLVVVVRVILIAMAALMLYLYYQ